MNQSSPFTRTIRLLPVVVVVLSAIVFISLTTFEFEGEFEGLYLFKHRQKLAFSLQNDIYVGDEQQLVCHVDFAPLYALVLGDEYHPPTAPFLRHEWNRRSGRGFVMNYFSDGTRLLSCFGRFRDSDGSTPKGLFLGGGLPPSKQEAPEITMNGTGMAFFDGKRWNHIWCSVNESIVLVEGSEKNFSPSQWSFLGSKVVKSSSSKLVIRSDHEVRHGAGHLRITRFVFFRAGERYFTLGCVIRNTGNKPVLYHYIYGDEPWVGDFGTSAGDVGWVRDRLFFFEGDVDPTKYSFAGMYDLGNPYVPGERHPFTGYSNFLEWLGSNRPDLVYFSNVIGKSSPESDKVPLASPDNRVLFLQWGPRHIEPGQEQLILLGVGMGNRLPGQQLPVKPEVHLEKEDVDFLRQR